MDLNWKCLKNPPLEQFESKTTQLSRLSHPTTKLQTIQSSLSQFAMFISLIIAC